MSMEFLATLLEVLGIPDTTANHHTLQEFWSLDVEFELMIRSDDCKHPLAVPLANKLSRLIMPMLRVIDYTREPFALEQGEELILLPDPSTIPAVKRKAEKWVNVVNQS